jgi:hypothetical protein
MPNIKSLKRLYKMNRLWGDNIWVASYYALKGKAFSASYQGRLLDEQITIDNSVVKQKEVHF